MAEELKNLLDRIRRDGVEKADAEAVQLMSAAHDKAAAITGEAEAKAKVILQKAEQDSLVFVERGKTAVEQAARNVILAVGEAVNNTMSGIVNREVSGVLTSETLKQMLVAVVEAYCTKDSHDSHLEVLLNPEQQKEITDHLMSKCAEAFSMGLEVKADNSIVSGFRVSLVNQRIQHDFSGKVIAEALCQLLRPQLAEIVRKSVSSMQQKSKDGDKKSPPPKAYPPLVEEVKSQ